MCKFSSTPKVLDDIQCFRLFRLMCMKTSLGIVANAQLPDHSVISVRLKRIPSIQRKIERSTTNLSQVDDIIGLRIICQSFSEAVELSSRMEFVSSHKRTKNYISEPRNTGYLPSITFLSSHKSFRKAINFCEFLLKFRSARIINICGRYIQNPLENRQKKEPPIPKSSENFLRFRSKSENGKRNAQA